MIFEIMLRRFIGGKVKPKALDIKDNVIELLKEDLECVHMYLDDIQVPRTDDKGEPYSIVGRIKELELKQTKALSELESSYLQFGNEIVKLLDENDRLHNFLDKKGVPRDDSRGEFSFEGRIEKLEELYQKKFDKLTEKPKNPEEPIEYLVGTLNKPFGLVGFNRAEIGHEVYEKQGKYVIYLSNDKVAKHEVGFFKETLNPAIDFFVYQ